MLFVIKILKPNIKKEKIFEEKTAPYDGSKSLDSQKCVEFLFTYLISPLDSNLIYKNEKIFEMIQKINYKWLLFETQLEFLLSSEAFAVELSEPREKQKFSRVNFYILTISNCFKILS
jgi:hypothetical protein